MDDTTPTIFIIDDDQSVLRGLSRLVKAAGMEVEVYDSAQSFLSRQPYNDYGCILLDVNMPGLSGLELQTELIKSNSTLSIIFISGQAEIPDVATAMRKGAVDFLTKPIDRDHLLQAISETIEIQQNNREVLELRADLQNRLVSLTPREHSILEFVISGALNKQIAFILGITEDTVKVHRGRVMKKMGANSLAELVRFADLIYVKPALIEER